MTENFLYDCSEIRQLEQLAMHEGHNKASDLMEHAGQAAFQLLNAKWPLAHRVHVFCGKGNNGGDGYVVARLAQEQGLDVKVWQVGDHSQLSETAHQAYTACVAAKITMQAFDSEHYDLSLADVIVDALLGIGLKNDVSVEYAAAMTAINQAGKTVLALDVPSGIDANTGKVCGIAVHANATITFLGLKPGLFTGQAPAYCGEIKLDDLGLPLALRAQVAAVASILNLQNLSTLLPPRARDAHKGYFGHVLVVGGNKGMGGAVRLAAEAAGRVGAGLISVAMRSEYVSATTAVCPELMCHGIETSQDLSSLLAKATVIVLGAGLGQDNWATSLFIKAIHSPLPKVVDADALNLLAQQPFSREDWVLTPHPGEAARLLGCTTADIQADRLAAANALHQRYGGVIVLKGAGTVVKNNHNPAAICIAGNPGMASGGMGDVLGGVIAGLLAQKLSLVDAAQLGVLIHAMAADSAAQALGERGLLAADLLPELRKLVN